MENTWYANFAYEILGEAHTQQAVLQAGFHSDTSLIE